MELKQISLGLLIVGSTIFGGTSTVEAGVCNVFGCSESNVACNPFGCPNPGATECSPFGCPKAPQSENNNRNYRDRDYRDRDYRDRDYRSSKNVDVKECVELLRMDTISGTLKEDWNAGEVYVYEEVDSYSDQQLEAAGLRQSGFPSLAWYHPHKSKVKALNGMSKKEAVQICLK